MNIFTHQPVQPLSLIGILKRILTIYLLGRFWLLEKQNNQQTYNSKRACHDWKNVTYIISALVAVFGGTTWKEKKKTNKSFYKDICNIFFIHKEQPHVTFPDIIRESKTVVDSGFHAVEPHSRYCFSEYLSNMELSSGFQLSAGFRIPWVESQIPKPRILDFTSKTFPDCGFHRPKIPGCWNLSFLTLGEIIQDEITGSCLCHQQCWKLESAVESDRASVCRLAYF